MFSGSRGATARFSSVAYGLVISAGSKRDSETFW